MRISILLMPTPHTIFTIYRGEMGPNYVIGLVFVRAFDKPKIRWHHVQQERTARTSFDHNCNHNIYLSSKNNKENKTKSLF